VLFVIPESTSSIFVRVAEILVSVSDSTSTLTHISGSLIPILVKGDCIIHGGG
jgi:hypothetical protein